MPGVEIRSLVKDFGTVRAVDSISLDIPDQKLMTLLGPSGCGKSTILRMIAGLERPSGGEIRIGDMMVNGPSVFVPAEQRRVGMVFQSYAIWPHLTVFENVAFPLRVRRFPKGEIGDRVRAVLQMVDLVRLDRRYATELSGGQQQRVALARAVVFEPALLLLDEPLSNLDAKLRQEMRAEIRSLQTRLKITTVFVTHDQEEALSLSDTVALLRDGRVEQIGTPLQLYQSPQSAFAAEFLGRANLLKGKADGLTIITFYGRLEIPTPAGILPGTEVAVMIRQEDVRLSPPPLEGPCVRLTGILKDIIFLGTSAHLLFSVGGEPFRVLASTRDLPELGAQHTLWVRPEWCRVLQSERLENA